MKLVSKVELRCACNFREQNSLAEQNISSAVYRGRACFMDPLRENTVFCD